MQLDKSKTIEHINTAATGDIMCGNLHQNLAADLSASALAARAALRQELAEGVLPTDLTIGGAAVSAVVGSTKRERFDTLDLGEAFNGPSEGTASLVRWVTDDASKVMQFSMNRTWTGYNPRYGRNIQRLADQQNGKPDMNKRALEIAMLIGLTSDIIINTYAMPDDLLVDQEALRLMHDGKPIETVVADDDSLHFSAKQIKAEAEWLASSAKGWAHIGGNVQTIPEEDDTEESRWRRMLRCAELAIDSYRVQGEAEITEEEQAESVSRHIHRKLRNLIAMTAVLSDGLDLMHNGRQLRLAEVAV